MIEKVKGIVTTPRRRLDLEVLAEETAQRLGIPFVARDGNSYVRLREENCVAAIYVETDDGPLINTEKGNFIFHENTSGMRTYKSGTTDPVVRALDAGPDGTVLDATTGLATDSLVIAYSLDGGRVTALESSPLLADVVRRGLENYEFTKPVLKAAAGRIDLVCADHAAFLRDAADGSFDAVYFDPMFSQTVATSSSMQRLKVLADHPVLDMTIIMEAKRVARRRVVVKSRRGENREYDFDEVLPSGNRLFYGIFNV